MMVEVVDFDSLVYEFRVFYGVFMLVFLGFMWVGGIFYSFGNYFKNFVFYEFKILSVVCWGVVDYIVDFRVVIFLGEIVWEVLVKCWLNLLVVDFIFIYCVGEFDKDWVFFYDVLDMLFINVNDVFVVLIWDMEWNWCWYFLFY